MEASTEAGEPAVGGSKDSLQKKVRDVFRRGLHWRRNREPSLDQASVRGRTGRDAGTRWSYISSSTITQLRRLFSNAATNDEADALTASSQGMKPKDTMADTPSEAIVSGLIKHFENLNEDVQGSQNSSRSSLRSAGKSPPEPDRSDEANNKNGLKNAQSCDEKSEISKNLKYIKSEDADNLSIENGKNSQTNQIESRNKLFEVKDEEKSSCQRNAVMPRIVTQHCDSDSEIENQTENLPSQCQQSTSLEPNGHASNHTRKSPVTVQEWVDSIPLTPPIDEPEEPVSEEIAEQSSDSIEPGTESCPAVTVRPASDVTASNADQRREAFSRDASPSLQSDTGSHASSVDSFLEARRPDPEEVLLNLGFGGPLHHVEAEVSRIPSRFLQPSKVKGVAIDDFLKYQQDMIETFESGFCGYRGLTGGSQIPSVIVAKIMEKLREHDRESSVKSSAGSSPGHEHTRRRFSRAAQKVTALTKLKSRDSLGSGLTHSVLNPDNRKFLESQGSKSPEVSRKRMIIGQRSFTFDGDGHLIEMEATQPEAAAPEVPPAPVRPPPPRPLIHKDSILSSTTSLSLTSYDSDSDADEAPRRVPILHRLHSSPATSSRRQSAISANGSDHGDEPVPEERRKSLPNALDFSTSYEDTSGNSADESSVFQGTDIPNFTSTPYREKERSWRDLHRIKSAPSFSSSLLSISSRYVLGTHVEETPPLSRNSSVQSENNNKSGEHVSSSPDRQSNNDSSDLSKSQNSSSGPEKDPAVVNAMPRSSEMYLDNKTRRLLSLTMSTSSYDGSPTEKIQDQRGWSSSSISSWESEPVGLTYPFNFQPPKTTKAEPLPTIPSQGGSRRGSLKRQQNVEEEEEDIIVNPIKQTPKQPTTQTLNVDQAKSAADKGDSFEMEELCVEEEGRMTRTGSAHSANSAYSDSSGFQEEGQQRKTEDGALKVNIPRAPLSKQLSESEPLLSTIPPEEDGDFPPGDQLKRLSLPVIRVQDESGQNQFRGYNRGPPSNPPLLRRVRSLPSSLTRIGVGRFSDSLSPCSASDSIGNMFSSCSDDSVIHVPFNELDASSSPNHTNSCSLASALAGDAGEQSARRAILTQQRCTSCNSAVKGTMIKCRRDLSNNLVSGNLWTQLIQHVHTLSEAHQSLSTHIRTISDHLGAFEKNSFSAFDQVVDVVRQQGELCHKLELLAADLPNQSTNTLLPPFQSCQHSSCMPPSCHFESDSSTNTCLSICRKVLDENLRLQSLVQFNTDELAQLRRLLYTVLDSMNRKYNES